MTDEQMKEKGFKRCEVLLKRDDIAQVMADPNHEDRCIVVTHRGAIREVWIAAEPLASVGMALDSKDDFPLVEVWLHTSVGQMQPNRQPSRVVPLRAHEA